MSNRHFLTKNGNWVTVADDELYHWKYIKRKKVNGKWRYYYNNEEYKAYESAVQKESVATDILDKATRERYAAAKTMSNAIEKYKKAEAMPGSALEYKGHSENRGFEYVETEKGKKMNDAEEQYMFTKEKVPVLDKQLGSARSSLIKAQKAKIAANNAYNQTFGAKLANFLNNSTDSIDKAKSWVNRLLSKDTPKPKLSDPNGEILYENVIKEDIIKEDKIYDNIIKDDKIYDHIIRDDLVKEEKIYENGKSKKTVKKKR